MQRLLTFTLFNVLPFVFYGQSVELSGRVAGGDDVENIHVINKTQQLFTITDKNGRFTILTKLNDTLSFSSIQHQTKEVVVSNEMIKENVLFVFLEAQINELDEVVVGKVLTGNLMSDIENMGGKPPINFFDVGIPGYTGKPATQSERRLSEASSFSPKLGGSMGGAGGSIAFTPIINAITGRTKMLKNRVELEEREALMQRVKSRLAKDFFLSNPLDDDLKMDFFYFCADDEHFIKYCKNKTDFEILIFLRKKYRQYNENLSTNKK